MKIWHEFERLLKIVQMDEKKEEEYTKEEKYPCIHLDGLLRL